MGFHNSTNETGQTLATYRQSAMKQEEAVLALFRNSTIREWAPSEVCDKLNSVYGRGWPVTSIRRAITDLCTQGLLVRTQHKCKGPYGKSQYKWRLSDGQ